MSPPGGIAITVPPADRNATIDDQPSAMRALRRLYVYAVAGATLVIVAIGLVNLLSLGLDQVFRAISGEDWIQGGPDWERERLSLAIPFIAIATPIWYLHWRMAERALHGPDAAAERRSAVRAVYFAIVFLAGLQLLIGSFSSALGLTLERLLGAPLLDYERDSVVTSLAIALVIGALWAWHLRTYRRDVRVETAETRFAIVPQAVLYLAAAIGSIMLLIGIGDLIRLGVDALDDRDRFGDWWREPLASGIALAVTGAIAWGFHWPFTERLLRSSGWWGRGERGASLRRIFLVATLLVTAAMALMFIADGADGIARLVLDAPQRARDTWLTAIAGPLLTAVPPIGFWLLYRRRLLAEPAIPGVAITPVAADRLLGYPMAALGIVAAGIGAALLLAEAIELVTGEGGRRTALGWPLGMLLGGGALWAVSWWATRPRLARDPEAEQASTARRAYLFVVLGGALVALVVGLAMTVYQVMQEVLGVSEAGSLTLKIALPLGITVVTAAIAASHGLLLRRDLPVRGLVEREEAGARQVELLLTVPEGGDPGAAVAALRHALPPGATLETRPPHDRPD